MKCACHKAMKAVTLLLGCVYEANIYVSNFHVWYEIKVYYYQFVKYFGCRFIAWLLAKAVVESERLPEKISDSGGKILKKLNPLSVIY